MELSDSQYDEMVLLSTKRWNPRVGRGKGLGIYLERSGIAILLLWFASAVFIQPIRGLFGTAIDFAIISVLLAPTLWFRWKQRELKKCVLENDYFLCPWCQYALTDLNDTGRCPECGQVYERELCRTLYKSIYSPIKPDWNVQIQTERKAWRRAILLRDGMIEPSEPITPA